MPSWLVSVIFYGFILIWTFIFIFRFREHITPMTGMMCAMTTGMIAGFGGGTVIAALLPLHFLLSAVASALLGLIAGAAVGAYFGLVAFLDGALSGMMAGMMGAMLVAMLPSTQWEQTIFFGMVAGGLFHFVQSLMLQGQIREERLSNAGWAAKSPAFMLFATASLIFAYTSAENVYAIHQPNHDHHHDGYEASPPHNGIELNITASDFAFSPNTLKLKAGTPYLITFYNNGSVEHDFAVSALDIHIHAMPGESVQSSVTIAEPGVYRVKCTLPGHEEAGMFGTITVTDE
ncbi:cupredoxin domain-containing protein [Paenibacillus alkalitolerans]|uniref:cupredoxin domain-containing protein n=1 Tax=Paenibacillus alkalitolerans TaxID=2799335 RepID=UPI0018F531F3|nr:cupredoxin domain-containing protein [Paenibacillus alkalitolerans]